jgi:hypothetical protein
MSSVRLALGMAFPASFGFAEGLGTTTSISSGFFSFWSQSPFISVGAASDGNDNEQIAVDLVDVGLTDCWTSCQVVSGTYGRARASGGRTMIMKDLVGGPGDLERVCEGENDLSLFSYFASGHGGKVESPSLSDGYI